MLLQLIVLVTFNIDKRHMVNTINVCGGKLLTGKSRLEMYKHQRQSSIQLIMTSPTS